MAIQSSTIELFNHQMGSIRNIHFVGIGGVGMCGIAEVLCTTGYNVTGSDINQSETTKHLQSLGVIIYPSHSGDNIINTDVVVVSTAIGDNNPEVKLAHKHLIPVITRAQMLGEIMRFRYGIAVSGTHGKTTTTSLISCIMSAAGLDPTYVIGGKLNGGTNAKLGSSKYIVVEADESDVSFLDLKPMTAVVTNIDPDHIENYNGSFDKLQESFYKFLKLLPFYGLAVLCIEDEDVEALATRAPCKTVTYGFNKKADLCATDCEVNGLKNKFTLLRKYKPSINIELNLPGRHNILNALGAIAAVSHLGISDEAIINSLANFSGVKRRFDLLGEFAIGNGYGLLLDDYGHHPVEIEANIAAVRSVWPEKRIVMLFQPHRYTRLQSLFSDFVDALSKVDVLFLLDVYSAGEEPIKDINSLTLSESLINNGQVEIHLLVNSDGYYTKILPYIKEGDVLVTQGAGSIGNISNQLAKEFNLQPISSNA